MKNLYVLWTTSKNLAIDQKNETLAVRAFIKSPCLGHGVLERDALLGRIQTYGFSHLLELEENSTAKKIVNKQQLYMTTQIPSPQWAGIY